MNNTFGGAPNSVDAVRQANMIAMIRIGLSHCGAIRTANLPAFRVDSGEMSLFVVPHCMRRVDVLRVVRNHGREEDDAKSGISDRNGRDHCLAKSDSRVQARMTIDNA